MLRPFYNASVWESRISSATSRPSIAPRAPGTGDHQDRDRESVPEGTITPTPTNLKPKPKDKSGSSRSTLSSSSATVTTTPSGRSRSVSTTCSRRILMGIKSEESARPVVENHGAGTHFVCQDEAGLAGPYDALGEFDEIEPEPIHYARSADELLIRGIGDYTFRPGADGIVGKGKFSTVYKVKGIKGEVYALKHTPLYPHHPLIAARLLREPTLLAQLPPHPCLIGVQGYIKTPDHVYLVEQLSRSHAPLSALEDPISVGLAGKILDQLVSVVRDGLHRGGRVCHRDLKADNLLIDGTGHILLLDLGLATHFSLSKPRLTTCCGSPAYHSPEIVDALRNPPGTRTYYGPELDIWCIGLTLLSLLTGRKYPISTSHKFPDVMAQGVVECLMEADKMVEEKSYRDTGSDLNEEDWEQWVYVKKAIEGFMNIDGDARMRTFGSYEIGRFWQDDNAFAAPPKDFKTISFEKSEIKHPLPIYLSEQGPGTELAPDDSEQSDRVLWMSNPEHIGIKNVISYVKYLMRTEGILYHCMAFADDTAVIQCVLPLSPDSPLLGTTSSQAQEPWSLSGLFARRAVSVPPKTRKGLVGRSESGPRLREHNKKKPCLRFWMRVRCNSRQDPMGSPFSPLRETALDSPSSIHDKTLHTPTVTKSPLSIVTNIISTEETELSSPSALSPKRRPGFKLSNIKTSPLMAVNREHSYSSVWPCASLPDTFSPPGTPSTGSPWVQIELSDARAKDIMKKALSQERWQSLGLEPLVMASRSSSRAGSRVRTNWGASRQVSGDSSRISSPLVTPMLELTEEDFFPSSRGRGRAAEGKRNTPRTMRDLEESIPRDELDPVLESNALHLERRSSSARPSPPEPSPLQA